MEKLPRPVLVVSKCLGFEACRFDGGMARSDVVERLKAFADFKPVCPEMEIGLGVPRRFVRLVGARAATHMVQPATGLDLTDRMAEFSSRFLGGLKDIDGFVLKSRSPSCGIGDVKHYSKIEEGGTLETSSGMFGAAVLRDFGGAAVEDEDRLRNARILDHFLTKLFTNARFRKVREAGNANALVGFHSDNKYLLMVHSPASLRAMGRLVANHERMPMPELMNDYGMRLGMAMAKGPTFKAHINFLQHAFGYVSEKLGRQEKDLFLDMLKLYLEDRVPLASPMSLLRAWVARFDVDYLKRQTIFEPYPIALAAEGDPGREKDFWKQGLA